MALAVRLLLNVNVDHYARALRHVVPESFFVRIGSVGRLLFMAPGCSPPSDNAARCNPVGTAEFRT